MFSACTPPQRRRIARLAVTCAVTLCTSIACCGSLWSATDKRPCLKGQDWGSSWMAKRSHGIRSFPSSGRSDGWRWFVLSGAAPFRKVRSHDQRRSLTPCRTASQRNVGTFPSDGSAAGQGVVVSGRGGVVVDALHHPVDPCLPPKEPVEEPCCLEAPGSRPGTGHIVELDQGRGVVAAHQHHGARESVGCVPLPSPTMGRGGRR